MLIVIEVKDTLVEKSLLNEGYLPQEIGRTDRENTAIDLAAKVLENFSENKDEEITIKIFHSSEI